MKPTLKFITCGSVDDGKSTLIGRLLLDSHSVMLDQIASASKSGTPDLALFTDGLLAEREQGITIDVAYRYFNTSTRKFIIGDTPGHEQYTRNMVTAASNADAAIVLVDATKLDWKNPQLNLLLQTCRHSLLVNMLRVQTICFVVNKLDAVDDSTLAFKNISTALKLFASKSKIEIFRIVPISALKGFNVVKKEDNWCDYNGPSLLSLLEQFETSSPDHETDFAMPVQLVEKTKDDSSYTRVFWGLVSQGTANVGETIQVIPSGQTATITKVISSTRSPSPVIAGKSAGILLDKELDISRGDWLIQNSRMSRDIKATVAWMDTEPLVVGRSYWVLHGHKWVKAKIKQILYKLNVNTMQHESASQLAVNEIGEVELLLQEAIVNLPFSKSKNLGSLLLVDTASNRTSGAALICD